VASVVLLYKSDKKFVLSYKFDGFGVAVGILGYYATDRGFDAPSQTFVCMNMSVCRSGCFLFHYLFLIFINFFTLIRLGGVGTKCFSSYCNNLTIIYTTDPLPAVNLDGRLV
jgi:hypothetical protein